MGFCGLAIREKKDVANNDDVSDVDDVDLECRWRATYSSADRSYREVGGKSKRYFRMTNLTIALRQLGNI